MRLLALFCGVHIALLPFMYLFTLQRSEGEQVSVVLLERERERERQCCLPNPIHFRLCTSPRHQRWA